VRKMRGREGGSEKDEEKNQAEKVGTRMNKI
jgi:hypothetical protein